MTDSLVSIPQPFLFAPADLKSVLIAENVARGFNIPIYQRLFAWTPKEVAILLGDFYNSFIQGKGRHYFVGNLTLNYNSVTGYLDIIDGQQRITTLWLIGLVLKWKTPQINWASFLQNDYGISLRFIAREDDNVFLNSLIKNNKLNELSEVNSGDINQMMIAAIKCIIEFLEDNKRAGEIDDFSNFIFNQVKLAAVFLPEEIDLNKYFEDMNNRGLQLEAHHILKAYLLEKIPEPNQIAYGDVWDAVSQMNQYVEYGLKGTLKENRNLLYDKRQEQYFIKAGNGKADVDKNKLSSLISEALNQEYKIYEPLKKDNISDNVVSIVNFSEFLLHVLNIFSKNKELPDYTFSYDDKKLIETFKNSTVIDSKYARDFIHFLFRARLCFDESVIKSITTPEGNHWEIRKIVKRENEDEFERKKYYEGNVVQLQSLLYVSTTATLWLTDVLNFILTEDKATEESLINCLETIDRKLHNNCPSVGELSKGVTTSRYWFFKLDYLLWKKWSQPDSLIPEFKEIDNLRIKIKNFQFRDNRSVEHIQPRSPEGKDWELSLSDNELKIAKIKDNFGNLALISISSNSSYNNQLPKLKRDDFIKRSKNWGIESLKLLDAYQYDWTIENMNTHQDEMIKIISDEYKAANKV